MPAASSLAETSRTMSSSFCTGYLTTKDRVSRPSRTSLLFARCHTHLAVGVARKFIFVVRFFDCGLPALRLLPRSARPSGSVINPDQRVHHELRSDDVGARFTGRQRH